MPSSGTMLPPAVRYARIIGTVGSGIIAGGPSPFPRAWHDSCVNTCIHSGLYYTHSRHTVPSLIESAVPADKIAKSFNKVKTKTDRPILYTLLLSSSSLAYVSCYLYNNPPTDQGVSTTTFSSRSFLPSTSTEHPHGYGWAMYGASTLLLAIIVPYSKFMLKKPQQNLAAAAESVEQSEKRKLVVSVVEDGEMKRDLQEWGSKSAFRAGLAGAATIIGVIALAG